MELELVLIFQKFFFTLNFIIICVTTSDAHAIIAFKFAAIDSILKPYPDIDLTKVIEKANAKLQPDSAQLRALKQTITKPRKIYLHTSEK